MTIALKKRVCGAGRLGLRASLRPWHCRSCLHVLGFAAFESRIRAWSAVAEPGALEVWGGERAPRTVWSRMSARSRKWFYGCSTAAVGTWPRLCKAEQGKVTWLAASADPRASHPRIRVSHFMADWAIHRQIRASQRASPQPPTQPSAGHGTTATIPNPRNGSLHLDNSAPAPSNHFRIH